VGFGVGFATIAMAGSQAAVAADCPADHDKLGKALKASVKPSGGPTNGGLDNNEWAALVTRDGAVCAVAFSGGKSDDQWPGSRALAAEKANTANGLSLTGFALSTANLYAGAQPGGSLFGLALSAPPNPAILYSGDPNQFGSASDPLIGKSLGGVITFGGGLALYDGAKVVGWALVRTGLTPHNLPADCSNDRADECSTWTNSSKAAISIAKSSSSACAGICATNSAFVISWR
jgi:hypothetical protein